ncbi:uncharacterized protein isoform X2 [Takifugu rubripes]|uniref:uncharacterized protein isoform X2 n=1 Tax=Takifugu rubripes TaxID=31033 RepID=UPI0011451D88|nr:uncharacterized protein LOC105419011 isoform X2 [Takifugu rubripes]
MDVTGGNSGANWKVKVWREIPVIGFKSHSEHDNTTLQRQTCTIFHLKTMKRIYSQLKKSRTPLLVNQTGPPEDQELATSHDDGPQTIVCTLPRPPADLPGNLCQYLLAVQETVRKDLGPHLKNLGSMGAQVESYHRQIFDCFNHLLQKINDLQSLFILMQWVCQTYPSQEMFGPLLLQDLDVRKNVDLLLLTEWVTNAKNKLLHRVKEDFRASVGKILEMDRTHVDGNNEEACVRFYVDIIQLTEGLSTSAGNISSSLVSEVREICFQELLNMLLGYTAEQMELLEKKTKIDEREMTYFLKTLKTCKEIKQHVRTTTTDVTRSLLQDIVAVLEPMEAFTLTCVKKMMSKVAKSLLKSYFTGKNKQFFYLIHKVKTCFPNEKWCQDVMEMVVVEIYNIVAHTYLTYLVKVRQNKLTNCWSPNIGQTVTEDAELLHDTISELVPGVDLLNPILKVTELLECDSHDMVLLTMATLLQEFPLLREDLVLQVALLRWNRLSAWQARKVLEAIPGRRQSTSVSWFRCLA